MTRIIDHDPPSDEELPDVKSLGLKPPGGDPNNTRIATAAPALKSPEKALIPKSPAKSIRKVRRLETGKATLGNPLFQSWNSEIVEDSTRLDGSPSKRSPKKSRLFSQEQSMMSMDASIFDMDAKPRQPRMNPLRLSRPRITATTIDDSEDSLGSVSSLSVKVDGIAEEKSSLSTHAEEPEPESASVEESQPTLHDSTAPESDYDDDDDADPARQLQLEASIYADRSAESLRSNMNDGANDSSDCNNSGYDSIPDLDDSLDDNKKTSPAKLLFGTPRQNGHNASASLEQADSSILQPKHTNVRSRKPESAEDGLVKNKLSIPPALSPVKGASPEKQGAQRLRVASQATTTDLADSLKELRIHFDESAKDDSGRPTTPSKKAKKSAGLLSPTKLARIPKTPHRPSVDAFWSQEFVDEWNDQHSPRKMPPAAKKSPVKTSPSKEKKRQFEAKKHTLAEEFLFDLDSEITQGKIAELAQATGGVNIVWTKTLNTTAGRANWKRETIRTKQADGTEVSVHHKHHASIELAEKVIDDEHRLLNVLAHEFCHLATFMIDGVSNNPHGKEFQAWAARCSQTFSGRGIKVTTKHTYDIDFKYVWQCAECSTEYKRHSRSIDPKRHRCGNCKSELQQTRPVPRKGKGGAGTRQPTEYQAFVRDNMSSVKASNPGINQKEVMKTVAGMWSKRKEEIAAASASSLSTVSTSTTTSSGSGADGETTIGDVSGDVTTVETTVADTTVVDATAVDLAAPATTQSAAPAPAPALVKADEQPKPPVVDAVVNQMVGLTL